MRSGKTCRIKDTLILFVWLCLIPNWEFLLRLMTRNFSHSLLAAIDSSSPEPCTDCPAAPTIISIAILHTKQRMSTGTLIFITLKGCELKHWIVWMLLAEEPPFQLLHVCTSPLIACLRLLHVSILHIPLGDGDCSFKSGRMTVFFSLWFNSSIKPWICLKFHS